MDYNNLTPYISVRGGAKAIEFYKKVFDVIEIGRLSLPHGIVTFEEMKTRADALFSGDR